MKLAPSEYLRLQLERPLQTRSLWMILTSVFFFLPLSLLWSCLSASRARTRHKAKEPSAEQPWIISVGNVSVGGTGKSPIVRALARLAFEEDFDVAILTRGVGKRAEKSFFTCIFPSHLQLISQDAWATLSDETLEHVLQLHKSLPNGSKLLIGQGPDRRQVLDALLKLRTASSNEKAKDQQRRLVVIVDDGLQQTSLSVHRDIVVWDPNSAAVAPLFCLPFGPYRMGWPFTRPWSSSLPRADVIVWSRLRSVHDRGVFESSVRMARQKIFQSENRESSNSSQKVDHRETAFQVNALEQLRLVRILNLGSSGGIELQDVPSAELGSDVVLVAGIARPDRFVKSFTTLFSANASKCPRIAGQLFLADHALLSQRQTLIFQKDVSVVTTLKDACRWWNVSEVSELVKQKRLYALCLETALESAHGHFSANSFRQLCQLEGVEN